MDGRRRSTQTHKGNIKYRIGGRRPSKTTKVGKELQQSFKDKLVKFLKKNLDVFAWSHENMLGIDE